MKEQGNTPLQTAVTSNQRETSVVPTGQFNFIPVEDMFEGPETQLAEVLATDPGPSNISSTGIKLNCPVGTTLVSL